jgi:lysozyme
MTVSYDLAKLLAELSRDEGRRARMYLDSEGIETVGVGFNLRSNDLPEDVIDRLLEVSIDQAELALDVLEPRWRQLDGDRQRVLVNMAFNLGQTRFAGFKKFWAAIDAFIAGQGAMYLSVAADEMMASKWASQVGARATRLADRMRVQGVTAQDALLT